VIVNLVLQDDFLKLI